MRLQVGVQRQSTYIIENSTSNGNVVNKLARDFSRPFSLTSLFGQQTVEY